MSDALTKVAKAYPKQKFAIIDAKVDLPNVYSMQFNAGCAVLNCSSTPRSRRSRPGTWPPG